MSRPMDEIEERLLREDGLRHALEGILSLIDDGLLVRNTTNDLHWSSYLAEARRIVGILAAARKALETLSA